jgi:hypothetical protein
MFHKNESVILQTEANKLGSPKELLKQNYILFSNIVSPWRSSLENFKSQVHVMCGHC